MASPSRRFGIVGFPVSHSLSPLLHTTAFRALGFDASYTPLEVPPADLPNFFRSGAGDLDGFNVTIPHKRSVIAYLDEVEPEARNIGAVNTVVRTASGLLGCNTDVVGVERTLLPHAEDLRGCRTLVLGAGGAARAVVSVVLRLLDPSRIDILNRSPERADQLLVDLRVSDRVPSSVLNPASDEAVRAFAAADLLIQTTPVGMHPNVRAIPMPATYRFQRDQTVLDVIVAPRETSFLRLARASGATALDGLTMFLHQGAASFERWTGREFPIAAVRPVVELALTSTA